MINFDHIYSTSVSEDRSDHDAGLSEALHNSGTVHDWAETIASFEDF